MKRVAQSEFDLLSVARALTGGVSAEAVEPLLRTPRPRAAKLGPTAMALLKQTLSRGCVLELGRRGGWRDARHLRGEAEVVSGRLWQRHGPPTLHFSPATLELLAWLVASPLAVPAECKPLKLKGPLGLGDELLLYLASDLVQRCPGCGPPLGRSPAFRRSPLCWLGFPELLGAGEPLGEEELTGAAWDKLLLEGALLLEALQRDLARRWIAVERGKRELVKLEVMTSVGESQRLVLAQLAAALDRAGRRDLFGFVIEATGRLLRHRPDASHWIGGISQVGALSARQRAFRAAGALLAGLDLPRRWVEEAQTVRFFDDEYEASQLLLKQWEQLGNEGLLHAQQLVQRMQALDASVAPPGEQA